MSPVCLVTRKFQEKRSKTRTGRGRILSACVAVSRYAVSVEGSRRDRELRVSTADRVCLCVYTLSQFTKNKHISETRLDVIEIRTIRSPLLVSAVQWHSYTFNGALGVAQLRPNIKKQR